MSGRKVRVPRPALLPRGMRPRLDAGQRRDLGIVHIQNLDTLAKGQGDEALLWQWIGGVLTWSKVAELLQIGAVEMAAQLDLAHRLVERYGRTGRVVFTGPDYQLAKDGVMVMDELAELTDRPTAVQAAEWSEHRVNTMAKQCAQRGAA